jgi:hypothetical protein
MDAEAEDKPTALTWLEVISKTRGYRNLVGHFAGKRPAISCFDDKRLKLIAAVVAPANLHEFPSIVSRDFLPCCTYLWMESSMQQPE